MTVAAVNAVINLTPTRWKPPLPSHIWDSESMATIGDGSGGIQAINFKLLTDSPLNIPPCSVEDLSAYSDDASHPLQIIITLNGGLLGTLVCTVLTSGTVINGLYALAPQILPTFPGKAKIRPRQPNPPLTASTLLSLSALNVNGKNLYGQAWGYLWQIPEHIEPWHPTWGMAPRQ